jgi:hypothetical protein
MAAKKKKPRELKIDLATTTISQAQQAMLVSVKAGNSVTCPCCKQLVMLYERPITSSMAKVLILLYSYFKNHADWLHVPGYLSEMNKIGAAVRTSDWSKLRYWGLIEEKPGALSDGSKRAGFYKITGLGHQFARGEVKVAKTAKVYNGRFLGFGDGQVSIQDCLGTDLDYDRLMAGEFGSFTI